jgi:N-acetylglutamate synthase-like GNAT family acetyltransferase
MKKHKGHGRKLLEHIDKKAKVAGAIKMKTGRIEPLSNEAIDFFEDMGYEFVQNRTYSIDSLCGTKKL